MVASSKFKASGFTEEVMQVNFWISQDHVHLNTLSPNWHFCVYFWQAQVFFCISTASLTFDIVYFFDKDGFPVSFRANLYRNNHIYNVSELSCDYRIEMPRDFLGDAPSSWVRTLPNFGSHGPCECGDITFLIYHVTTWSMYHVTLWVVSLILSHHPAKFGVHRPYGTGNNGLCYISSNSNSNSNAEVYKWPLKSVIICLHYKETN